MTLLAVWPASQSAFHDPKRWVLVVAALIGALISLPKWRWTALPLIALTAVQTWHGAEAGLQAMAFAWALASWQADVRWFTRLVGAAAALVGGVVLLQASGVDPLGFANPEVDEGRLRVYGTLGNPDFVASMLLPIAILLLPRSPFTPRAVEGPPPPPFAPSGVEGPLALLIIIPALIVTRSFATLLSAMVAAVVVIVHQTALSPTLSPSGRGSAWWRSIALVCGLIALLGVGLVGRDLGQTISGRRYLVSVALPHVTDAPLLGHGLGATVLAWPTWELSFWQARCPDAACVSADPRHLFAALQDHIHADWLEWLLERGILGFFVLLLALSAPLLAAWRSEDSLLLAAMTAMLARALVDFPLHRPADLCLLAALAACARSSKA